jgi:hypothetical protein
MGSASTSKSIVSSGSLVKSVRHFEPNRSGSKEFSSPQSAVRDLTSQLEGMDTSMKSPNKVPPPNMSMMSMSSSNPQSQVASKKK